MSKLIKILVVLGAMMALTSCNALLCEMGSATACMRYNKEVWTNQNYKFRGDL